DPWLEWFMTLKEDARVAFANVWEKARFTPGQGPLQQAFDAAREHRMLLPPEVAERRPTGEPDERSESDYEFFVSLAGHLQVIAGNQSIYLPCHSLAEMLKVSTRTVARYRAWAIE